MDSSDLNSPERPAAVLQARDVAPQPAGAATSRLPRFYRLTVEQRLALLQRSFGLSNEQVEKLRHGRALSIDHAVNMVENAIGVHGMPLGLGLNFLVDGRDYLVPMAIEEASIIAAASKAALMIRGGGGFVTAVDPPVMLGQIQLLDVPDMDAALAAIAGNTEAIMAQANLANHRMVARGGGCIGVETRVLTGSAICGPMLVVHLKLNVQEAMGANAINYACEAVGPLLQELTGARANLRIVSNYANERLARASFVLPLAALASEGLSGAEVGQRLVEAGEFARIDPYRAATHNKGIFNGIDAACLALGQDWRAIEAGGHAWAARDGQYRGLTEYRLEGENLHGSIELPLQVGWVGGAVNSHPGVRILRHVSGVRNARELAGLLAAVGLGQNFAACLALSTVGIQKGHMALHARSVALSVGVPAADVDDVAQAMIRRGAVKVAVAEEVFAELQAQRERELQEQRAPQAGLPIEARAPGKVVLFGEHAVVYGYPGITAGIEASLRARITKDPDGPRFLAPRFRQAFAADESDLDLRLFGQAVDHALAMYGLQQAPLAIELDGDLLPGMGLGSSAACSVALCLALRQYAGLPSERRYTPQLFEEVQQLESIFHGSPSGMDAATVLAGSVLWFRGGPPREILPIRLSRPLAGLICIVEPGARTIELVGHVRQSRELSPRRVDGIMEQIGVLTSEAGSALGAGESEHVGLLMRRNHELLAALGVSTPGLDAAVEHLCGLPGVHGAKLTGAGGGGAVIALVDPARREQLIEETSGRFPVVMPFDLGAGH